MGILASELDPYVHSNIYRFHGSLSDVTLDSTQGLRILKQEIAGIRTLATQLRAAAAQFSESNTVLNNRWETTPKRLEEVVREILESRTFLTLLVKERKETSDILYQLINKNRVREIRGKIAEDHAIISMEEAVRAVLDTIPTELLLTDRGGQRAVLASRFNAKALDAAIEKRLIRQLNADSKVFERIILESLEEVVSEEKKRLKYQGGMEDAMDYFTRQMVNKIFKSNQIWIYPVGGLEEYVARVTSDVRGIVARAISDAQLDIEEQRISSDVYSSGGSAVLDVEFGTGEGLSPEQMGKALQRALAEYSPPNRILLKGSDLEMRKGNDVVPIRNSTFEEEFMRRKVQDSPLVKALGSTNSYSRLMELIVSAPNAPLGRDDFANLSYVMANMIWFNTKGHISRGRKSMRAAERRGLTTSKGGLAYSHSLVMEILRESLASIIAFEISEDLEITPNKSAIFLLVRGRTIMSTYSMMEEVAKNLEAIVSRLESLDFTLYEGYSSRSAIEFYLSKSDAVRPDHLDPRRWYDDIRLTNVGRETGSQIIGTTQVRLGSNFSLMNALASSFIF